MEDAKKELAASMIKWLVSHGYVVSTGYFDHRFKVVEASVDMDVWPKQEGGT